MIFVDKSDRMSEEEAVALIEEYKITREDSIGEKLYKTYYRYIISFLAGQYNSLYSNDRYKEELISICSLCFFEHIGEYDVNKGKVTTFLTRHLKHAVSEHFNQLNGQTSYYGQKSNEIKRCIKELEAKEQPWDEAIIADKTGLPLKTVRTCLEQINSPTCYYSSNDFLEENISRTQESPESEVIAQEEAEGIRRAMKCLTESEKQIIELSFGFGKDDKPMTDTKISKTLNMKLEAVKRTKNAGMNKIARSFEREGLFSNRLFKKEITLVSDDICFIPRGKEALLQFAEDMAVCDIDF